jgi:hypothetical protein
MRIEMKKSILCLCACSLLSVGCGGGGGGGSGDGKSSEGTFYGGVYTANLTRVSGDCGANLPASQTLQVTVNQDGDRVVADIGRVTLAGATNANDGFDVESTGPGSNGCTIGTHLTTRDIGNGSGTAGLAFGATCRGVLCVVGYGGSFVRQGRSAELKSYSEPIDVDAIARGIGAGAPDAYETDRDLVEVLRGE